ncbi:SNF2 family DNA-dependent ATPase [Mycena kentingensis (nom. inval.)]|nr:SNF2 family DNA-dependent ATPase [Mycena kentingensis (nom. inval.)]
MAEDPALLFSPERPKTRGRQVLDFVEAQTLSPTTRSSYQEARQATVLRNTPPSVDEIIGEYTEGTQMYYFARQNQGIAHKFPAESFTTEYPGLVSDYLRKKTAGELAPFSPTAHYIHPMSRVKIKLSLSKKGARVSISSAGGSARSSLRGSAPPSSEADELVSSEEEDNEEDDQYANDDSDDGPVRRSTRNAGKTKQLPFSPKKTRSRKIILPPSDDDEDSNSYAPRRSTRTRKAFKVPLDGAYEDGSEPEEDDDSEGYESAPKAKRVKTVRRKVGVRPAYGHIRSVDDLDLDFHEDAETAALRLHRNKCEKCNEAPAHEQLEAERKRSKKRRKRKASDEFDESEDDTERIERRGGWVRCLKCPVAVHWGCLAGTQRDEILKAVREVDRAAWRAAQPESELLDDNGQPKVNKDEPRKRAGLEIHQITDYVCAACSKGGVCMGCMESTVEPEPTPSTEAPSQVDAPPTETSAKVDGASTDAPSKIDGPVSDVEMKPVLKYGAPKALLFRCVVCKRPAHYEHLPEPDDCDSIGDVAAHYTSSWQCSDCSSFTFQLDKILAWRPYPANATEPSLDRDEVPNYKTALPREYLVKWQDRSFRRTQWVPHMWLVSTNPGKLKNFLATGPKVELLESAEDGDADKTESAQFQVVVDSRQSSRIPPAWKTVDRVMDVVLWRPLKQSKKSKGKGKAIVTTEEETDGEVDAERQRVHTSGLEPDASFTETLEERKHRTGEFFSMEDIDEVAWAFIKWDDLTYDESTWDAPPRPAETSGLPMAKRLERPTGFTTRLPKDRIVKAEDLQLGQDASYKLMDFQIDGFNWLCDNWWNKQPCILADDMGLGKTVQALSLARSSRTTASLPALIVVPNSTITNWIREFERWAPGLRVVPYYGEAKSREVIRKFELVHQEKRKGFLSAKYHVLVTTYDTIIGKDFGTVFKNQPRWEVLVVDEGQRLKSDSSLLFKKLNDLNTLHRVIMTGTPLNNNIRELFNLMNFLDPKEWKDLEALTQQHEELDEELVKKLHVRLRPYFLRRIKSQVLKLPPKNEVIVPVSMAPLQKEIYRSILSHNLEILKNLKSKRAGTTKGKLNNVLMHLRKCLQHPYLYDETIEPRDLAARETHEKLIDASAKLRFLKALLPKLKAKGHRVLLFSQFVIALDIIEDFLTGEGLRFLRLDGNTKSAERQKGMDEFNRPGSDVFIYLLTTRAGGVGINLFTADTVIIFDPDFNPHQDLQAIARAYRYGQKNTCLVFKLMVKDSAEERIIQVGKKKLVLDHLIVQKMDDDEDGGDNVESILTFGAQTLFEENGSRDITYSDTDIDKLIEKTEQEAEPEQASGEEGAFSFSFAKVWSADKDTLEEVAEEEPQASVDSWAQTLQKINEDRDKHEIQELDRYGRGKQRKAARKSNAAYLVDQSPVKESRSRAQSLADNDSAYTSDNGARSSSDSDTDAFDNREAAELLAETINSANQQQPRKRKKKREAEPAEPFTSIHNIPLPEACSLCGLRHRDQLGACLMTQNSQHLAEFREMLILHPEHEPLEKRIAAIAAIDEILHQRGDIALIYGQPLEIVDHGATSNEVPAAKKAKATTAMPTATASQPVASGSVPTNAVASSSKRTLSPGPSSDGPSKKPRQSATEEACLVCKHVPGHLLEECPAVAEGPKRSTVARNQTFGAAARDGTGGRWTARKILSKIKKKEVAEAAEKDVIDLSQL